jgi:hypothetical protein
LAHAIHPVFVAGVALMGAALAFLAVIPEHPLRRTVRDDPALPAA